METRQPIRNIPLAPEPLAGALPGGYPDFCEEIMMMLRLLLILETNEGACMLQTVA